MLVKLFNQVSILLWKRRQESAKSKWEVVRIILPPILFMALINLGYSTIPLFSKGGIEPFLIPFAFFVFVQRVVIQIMYEKSNRLQEAMRMMGLTDMAYWISYFISEGVITGFFVSFICTIMSTGGLFNDASFGSILGLLFVYCLSVVPFCFFLCCFFDTPQTAGQAILGVLIGCFAVYVILFVTNERSVPLYNAQVAGCFFPPIALQLACGSFLKSHEGITLSRICGIMVSINYIFSFVKAILISMHSCCV
jgi:hypothetical protein